jgi:hypothetical protein
MTKQENKSIDSITVPTTRAEWNAPFKHERARKRQAIAKFVQGARTGDVGLTREALAAADAAGCLPGLIRAAGRLGSVPAITRDGFVWPWAEFGDSLRDAAGTDLELINALWVMLPPYQGPLIRLFRGESADNRKHRRYGACWSSKREVAEIFASERASHYTNGTVLLETDAPADAIISATHLLHNDFGEFEHVVDRRRLTSVRVLKRFAPT